MNQDSKTIKGAVATGLGALLLFPLLLSSILLSGCPSKSSPSSPSSTSTPVPATATPTATVTSTPIPGIYWQSAQFYRYEDVSGDQASINLTVNGQASTTVLVTINGTGFAAPVTLPYTGPNVAGGVTYATYYSTSSNLVYTAGGTVTLTTIAGSVTATGIVGEPGGNITVNASGTQVSWTYLGNAYDKAYVVQVPSSGIGVTIYTSPGTTPASPINISSSIYTPGYTYDVWTAIADGGVGYTDNAATGSSFVVYDTSETILTTYDFTNTPTNTGTPAPATSTFTPTSSPTPTLTSTPSQTATVTPTSTITATPTVTLTSTPAGLDITTAVFWSPGVYNYGYVHVHSGGGVLTIDGSVTLNLSGYLLVDAGATITGDGEGYSNGQGPGAPELVNEFSTPIPYTGSGAGHGGTGGPDGSGLDDGGIVNDTAQNPSLMGSGGGEGSVANGDGAGGGLFYALCPSGSITINGVLTMSGLGGANNGGSGQAGGGGAGGTLLLQGNTIYGTGVVEVNGGPGGFSTNGFGGGGGGGGRLEFVTPGGGVNNFTGTVGVNGGAAGGSTTSLPGAVGSSGSIDDASSL